MYFVGKGESLQLDIVGIVAILGEGSILRNAQASALSWHHVLPRLIPAPQALLKHEQATRLPTQRGIVSGVYSGNVRQELNFFTRLLHPLELKKNQIEVVEVGRDPDYPGPKEFIFGVNSYGVLPALSYLGCLMSCALLGLSIWKKDGFAFIATVLLSVTSTIVGSASRWKLIFQEENPPKEREKAIPDGDVVIYYPGPGAFRVIRCNEVVSRLYFQAEECEYLLNDNQYRVLAMAGSVTLVFGLVCLSNAHVILQIGFGAAYIILNALYWASSAYHERHHWSHAYKVTPIEIDFPKRKGTTLHDIEVPQQILNHDHNPPIRRPTTHLEAGTDHTQKRRPSMISLRRLTSRASPLYPVGLPVLQALPKSTESFTEILWTAIALTRGTRWLRTPIVPDTEVWERWVAEATAAAAEDPIRHGDKIILPRWDYKTRLKELLEEQKDVKKRRPTWPTLKQMSKLVSVTEHEKERREVPKMVPVVNAVKERLLQMQQQQQQQQADEPGSPGVQRRRTRVQFSDEDGLTQSPVNEAEE